MTVEHDRSKSVFQTFNHDGNRQLNDSGKCNGKGNCDITRSERGRLCHLMGRQPDTAAEQQPPPPPMLPFIASPSTPMKREHHNRRQQHEQDEPINHHNNPHHSGNPHRFEQRRSQLLNHATAAAAVGRSSASTSNATKVTKQTARLSSDTSPTSSLYSSPTSRRSLCPPPPPPPSPVDQSTALLLPRHFPVSAAAVAAALSRDRGGASAPHRSELPETKVKPLYLAQATAAGSVGKKEKKEKGKRENIFAPHGNDAENSFCRMLTTKTSTTKTSTTKNECIASKGQCLYSPGGSETDDYRWPHPYLSDPSSKSTSSLSPRSNSSGVGGCEDDFFPRSRAAADKAGLSAVGCRRRGVNRAISGRTPYDGLTVPCTPAESTQTSPGSGRTRRNAANNIADSSLLLQSDLDELSRLLALWSMLEGHPADELCA